MGKWLVSTHKNGESTICSTNASLKNVLGAEYPLLIKMIRADEKLSVQVHPDDVYARLHENDSGKTEFWYIVEARHDAKLICGVKGNISRDVLQKAIDDGNLETYLCEMDVKAGDGFFIPSGTVHAIGGGITILEIQQSSDVTYRLYDWGREREIHVEKSLDVINYEQNNDNLRISHFEKIETEFFTIEKINVKSMLTKNTSSLISYAVISGKAEVSSTKGDSFSVTVGDAFMAQPESTLSIIGDVELLCAWVPEKSL